MNFKKAPLTSLLQRKPQGFTLVEVLVSMTVLIGLLLVSAQVIGTVQNTWTQSSARISQFREARIAFDLITRNLSQATLNTYIDYDQSWLSELDNQSSSAALVTTAPQRYIRKSDLRFVCGPCVGGAEPLLQQGGGAAESPGHAVFFQAPLGISHNPNYVGLDRLLCSRGYFVQYTSDEFFRPAVLPVSQPRFRYRLMEFSPPAEQNLIYETGNKNAWFAKAGLPMQGNETPIDHGLTRPIADNIVALIIAPQLEIGNVGNVVNTSEAYQSVFSYDSALAGGPQLGAGSQSNTQGNQHKLPPLVKVVLVAIDENSAERLAQMGDAATPPLGSEINSLISSDAAATDLNATMDSIAQMLSQRRGVNYRIFSTTVAIRGAKWN